MTEICFVTEAHDPVACAHAEVLRAWAEGQRVRVCTADATMTARLDRMLWEIPREGFVPHVTLASPLAAVTPVIVDHADVHPAEGDVLINLAADPPSFFARFRRLVEIVGPDAIDKAAGRARWRHYKARGYTLEHLRAVAASGV